MRKIFTLCLLAAAAAVPVFAQNKPAAPKVDKPVYFDISPPLRDLVQNPSVRYDKSWKDGVVQNYFDPIIGTSQNQGIPGFQDAATQDAPGLLPSDTTLQNFDGLSAGGSVPPDTHGEAGPNHYFQVVNTAYAIYNKTGDKILGPLANSSVWAGMPNNANSGDALVLYDEVADRWLFTQFSLPYYPNGPFFQMIAVSQTPDPTGTWYRWEYEFVNMPDYPKFGVWPDGYYMSANRFVPGYQGTGAYAFDRTAMLAGNPVALRVSFEQPAGAETYSLLPSDCDGTFPPMGTPCYFTYARLSGSQHLGIWEFHADWNTPENSTFGDRIFLDVTPFATLSGGIPQLGTTIKLETLGDRLMYSSKYRVFNGYSAMVLNHSVSATGGASGVRWYELRKPGSAAWAIHQQSTYSPDNKSRWMGSIAIDTAGTIALGYSVSSSTIYPAIRYTGRFKNDPLNTMTIAEKTIINGGGCQTGSWSGRSRWGDYSSMCVDPASPTTFWYTTEYYPATSVSSWQTRVGSFTFGNTFSISSSSFPYRLCEGDSSQLEAFAYGGSGTYTYSWTSQPAGFTANIANPVVVPSDSTIYYVAVSDGSQTKTDSVRVNVVKLPTAFAGNDTILCSWAHSISLHGIATNYRMCGWGTTGNGTFNTSSGTDAIYTFGSLDLANGWVDLKFIALPLTPCYGNVISVRHVVIEPCTSVPESALAEPKLKLIPNPASEMVTITISGVTQGDAGITLTSMEGTLVSSFTLQPSAKGDATRRFDLSGFRKGVYIVKLQSDKGISSERLIVQ